MNGALAIEAITRGLHDVFAAIWAGGLLIMALVVMPTMKSMRAELPKLAHTKIHRRSCPQERS